MQFEDIKSYAACGDLPPAIAETLDKFCRSYQKAVENSGKPFEECRPILTTFIKLVVEEVKNPSTFEPYHQQVSSPFDYYQFGLDIIRPLIAFDKSSVGNLQALEVMKGQLANKENVIFFANHQTEPDPQIINLILEKHYPELAKGMVFLAGHRVISDPLAVPFSKGCNLLCIFSKKYIETPPDQKMHKQVHNQKTMKRMQGLLEEGGKCIYVAPSGGRDRINAEGVIEVAAFDPQSIEMFRLIAQQAKRPTHFYPLALSTYHLMPPPNNVEKELGERRHTECIPIHLAFGNEIDMQDFPGCDPANKQLNRQLRANYICSLVKADYAKF
ncbi:MAG: 1-acyl-sn-glycerol-3-phosphate acyltransferase [Parachlamydiaceae bacterium]|nr:1-acyl-sn-glycerol-3-phosphate acyltransferase [Parachlamydiaceae bacterium]